MAIKKDKFRTKLTAKKLFFSGLKKNNKELLLEGIFMLKDATVLFSKLSDVERYQIVNLCKEDLSELQLKNLLSGLNDESKISLIFKKGFLDNSYKHELINSLNREQVLKIFTSDMIEDKFQITQLICGIYDSELQLDIIENGKFDEYNILTIIDSITKISKEGTINKRINNILNTLGVPNGMEDLACKMIKYFRLQLITFIHNGIFTPELVDALGGESEFYSLTKNAPSIFRSIDLSLFSKNAQLFKKYLEFRKTFAPPQVIVAQFTQKAMLEFTKNFNLISECFNNGMTDKDAEILKSYLMENGEVLTSVNINSKNDLLEFPTRREHFITNMINENPDEAAILILTGMSKDNYEMLTQSYIGKSHIDSTIKYFGDNTGIYTSMMIATEMLEKLSTLDNSEKKEILLALNKDLSKEFDSGGSSVSHIRNSFYGAVNNIRQKYGENLTDRLTESQLPKSKPYKHDESVQVINLSGQNFKLLVHGLNAFGGGGGKSFETRDNGCNHLCTSLLSEICLGRVQADIYYGFNSFDKNALACQGTQDIYSTDLPASDADFLISLYGNISISANDLCNYSLDHINEVVLWREYVDSQSEPQKIQPDYIVCFDNISNRSLEESQKTGLPIVLINTKAYEKTSRQKYETEMPTTYPEDAMKAYQQKKQIMTDIINQHYATIAQANNTNQSSTEARGLEDDNIMI